jgi:hypothetical protein
MTLSYSGGAEQAIAMGAVVKSKRFYATLYFNNLSNI